jgi:hypothetical protein
MIRMPGEAMKVVYSALANPTQKPAARKALQRLAAKLQSAGMDVRTRPRGKSPQQSAYFTRSAELKQESSLLASVCSLLGVLPRTGAPGDRQALANLSRGELLCQAFEVYRELVADPRISFEHLVFLVSALTGGEELQLANCELCGALTVVDRFSFKARRCPHCVSRGG